MDRPLSSTPQRSGLSNRVRGALFSARHAGGDAAELREIADVVGADLASQYDATVALLVRCGTELPSASGIYAALAAVLSAKAPDFGAAVVRRAHASLERALRDPDVPAVRAATLSPIPENMRTGLPLRMAVRFVLELAAVGIVALGSALRWAEEAAATLLATLDDAPAESDARAHYADAVWHALASGIVWTGDELERCCVDDPRAVQRLVASLGEYVERRAERVRVARADASPLLDWGPDALQLTLATLRALEASRWDLDGVLGVDVARAQPWRGALIERADVVPEGSDGIAELRTADVAPPAHGDTPAWPLFGRLVRPFSFGLEDDGATWGDPDAAAGGESDAAGGESDAAPEEGAAPLVDANRALAGGAAEKVHKRAPPAQRWLLRQQLQDVLEAYMPAYTVAVEATLALEIPAGVRLEPIAVELLLGLAASGELTDAWRAYYARILFELCQVDSFKFAGAMRAGYAVVWRCCCGSSAAAAASAAEAPAEGAAEESGVELCVPPPRALSLGERARLARWLAFLLSNFEFGWMWEKWAVDAGLSVLGADEGGAGGDTSDAAMDEEDAVAGSAAARGARAAGDTSGTLFLRALLCRCFDLSRREVLIAVLPLSLHRIVPNAPVTSVPYLEERSSGHVIDGVDADILRRLHTGVSTKMRARSAGAAVAAWLVAALGAELTDTAPARGELEALALRIATDALLHIGSATIQHMVVMLDRNKDLLVLLKERCDAESGPGAADLAILGAAAALWRGSGSTRNLVFLRLLLHKVVRGDSCVAWLLCDDAVALCAAADADADTDAGTAADASAFAQWLRDVYVWEALANALKSTADVDSRGELLWRCVVRISVLAGENESQGPELATCADRVRELCILCPVAWRAARRMECPIDAARMSGWAAALVAALRQPRRC